MSNGSGSSLLISAGSSGIGMVNVTGSKSCSLAGAPKASAGTGRFRRAPSAGSCGIGVARYVFFR
jgi:hypothetical protein